MADLNQQIDELCKKLDSLKGLDAGKIASVGAWKLRALADPLVPRDTTFLANNVSVDVEEDGASLNYNAEYAYYQEYGTSKMAAQPYVRPTLDAHGDEILETMRNEVNKQLEEKLR